MKSYLSLVPISARVHKRRNRMTILCIVISVFLVTAVFSMAHMAFQSEKRNMLAKHGNWHIQLIRISEDDAEKIRARSDVSLMSWHEVINDDRTENYNIGGQKAVLHGMDDAYLTDIMNCLSEGTLPQNDREIVLSSNTKEIFGVDIGDDIRMDCPFGSIDYTVCGFGDDDAEFNRLYDTVSVYMNQAAFYHICESDGKREDARSYYVRFQAHANIRKSIADIKEQYGLSDENIDENTAVLGLMGVSSNTYVRNTYPIVAALILMILLAGVLMISGSMNSNVAERSQFFGMLRCIGANRQQIMRIVRLEALNWCKTAIPAGVLLGTVFTWVLCLILRFSVGGEFLNIPLFGVSVPGMASGALTGLVTVLLAAHSPAKCAARVSPMEAVTGNAKTMTRVRPLHMRFSRVETALGVHHAVSAKKNLFLMTGSFALSIILFLSFSALLDFVQALIPNLRPWQPDFAITCEAGSNSVDKGLADRISEIPGVRHVFGNMAELQIPVSAGKEVRQVNLVSYDDYLMSCAKKSRIEGDLSKVFGDSKYVLTVYNRDNPLKTGEQISLFGDTVEVAGIVSDGLFGDEITLICSEETFLRLTGETNYEMLNVQFGSSASDADMDAVRSLIGSRYVLSDYRSSNQNVTAEYWALRILAYGFLGVVAMITVLNIMNSTSMSVSAKIRQYGTMRAIGMDSRQLIGMLRAEVFTFAFSGGAVGCTIGLFLHRFIFERLVTTYSGKTWQVPVLLLLLILLLVFATALAAIHAPAKRIRNMSVTDTINEL